MRLLPLLFATVVLSVMSRAEFRMWEDIKGARYNAEFVGEFFDKVTLRDETGKEFRMGVEELSELDQKYMRVKVPPAMQIEFSRRLTQKPKPKESMDLDNDVTIIITSEVMVKKESNRPYTSRLYAELYLIGKEINEAKFVLVSRTEADFLFTESNNNQVTFQSKPIELRVFNQRGAQERRGELYEGYLLVIRDFDDQIVAVKTDMPEWIKRPEVIVALRELYVRGAGSMRSRYFDQMGHKLEVPRPEYYEQGRQDD